MLGNIAGSTLSLATVVPTPTLSGKTVLHQYVTAPSVFESGRAVAVVRTNTVLLAGDGFKGGAIRCSTSASARVTKQGYRYLW
jgi:hypothetical protein